MRIRGKLIVCLLSTLVFFLLNNVIAHIINFTSLSNHVIPSEEVLTVDLKYSVAPNFKPPTSTETLYSEKIELEMPTPSGFVEVEKLKPRKNVGNSPKKIQPSKAFPPDDPKSPSVLKARIDDLPINSSLAKFVAAQNAKRKVIKQLCKQIMLNSTTDATNVIVGSSQSIIIDRPNFLTFCPVFKAASTSWTINLLQLRGMWRESRKNKLQKLVTQVFQKVSNMIAPWMAKGTTKFLIVRHPFHRLVSCYRDKFEEASKVYYYVKYGERMVKMFRPRPPGTTTDEVSAMLSWLRNRLESGGPMMLPGNPYVHPIGPTFEEFIKFVVFSQQDDEHWRPYYMHCSACRMDYDFILRFEKIYSDSRLFIEYLNRTDEISSRWDNPTVFGSTTQEVVCKYFRQISSSLLTKLYEKYSFDFQLFGYSPDETRKCTKDYNKNLH